MNIATTSYMSAATMLYRELEPSGWGPHLAPLILGEPLETILEKLEGQNTSNFMTSPTLPQLFWAFGACPWRELRVVVFSAEPYGEDPETLIRWAQQGVLLLHPALTSHTDKESRCQALWGSFLRGVLDKILELNFGLVFAFLPGTDDWADLIPDGHHKLFVQENNSLENLGSEQLLLEINRILQDLNGAGIQWNLEPA